MAGQPVVVPRVLSAGQKERYSRHLRIPEVGELPDLSVRAVGEYDGPCFCRIRVEVASSHPPEELGWIVERAARVCYVSNTLRNVSEVEVTLA